MANSKAAGVMRMAACLAIFLLISAAMPCNSMMPQEFALGRKVLEDNTKPQGRGGYNSYEPNGRSGYNSYEPNGRSGYNGYKPTGRGGYN